MNPSPGLIEQATALLGSRPVRWWARAGGYSLAERFTFELDDGRRVFAKRATTHDIASFLRAEHRNMSAIDADYRCEVLAWEDGDRPILVLEDLSGGRWPPPWEPGDVGKVLETLHRVASTRPPQHLPSCEVMWGEAFSGWRELSRNPGPFLGLGVATAEWLDRCLATLVDAERACALDGDSLLHMDVRSDNLCLLGDRVVLVDWNWACRGRAEFDVACWAPALRLEGGPLPEELAPASGPDAAAVAGYFAAKAGLPPPAGAPTVRKFQQRQLRISLRWACRELGLPLPELDDVTAEIDKANADLASGSIDEETWHARVEEPLTDAYLSYAEPWRQSGKGGDETDWRWGRELPLDLAKDGDAMLDVGCANGYLMESFHKWGTERGLRIEPYGVDISWRLASLARRRLPQWSDRIFVANVMKWTPPRRFDIVHTALDYMPPNRRREHIERVLADFLVPGGYVVLRPNRMPKGPDPAKELEDLGLRPDGVLEATHPETGELRRTAYLRAPVA